ncbi:MAG: UDP-N-acetylmuramate dehydrogenase [Eubacteriales bacterium]|nr:UDP-N-acetylmuramate dehydrogenase [Eubacteriales bacterium]
MDYKGLFRHEYIDEENVLIDAEMKDFTSFKTGGKAAVLVIPKSVDQLQYVLKTLEAEKIKHMVLGNGSNILFTDKGYDGVVVKLGNEFGEIYTEGESVIAGASALLSTVSKFALREGLTGMEFASGIPGTIGGAAFMNAGAYGGEMKDIIDKITIIKADGSEIKDLVVDQLNLGYRQSVLQETGDMVLSVRLNLKKGNIESIEEKMKDFMKRRNDKQPVNYPSAGSFFKRPEGYFAGKLIEDAGLKGLTVGGAQVSTLHSGFVINVGGATATDIVDLMHLIQNTVYDKFGVKLEPEVRIIGD